MATSANITYRKLYTIGKSKLCLFQMCANGGGRQSGREDMSKTKMALNPRLRLEVFHVTVKRPSKVSQRKVRSLVRNRNIQIDYIWNKQWIICYFLFSKHCIFAITQWFSYQYITYYIPLESSDFLLSNGTVVKVKFPHIFYLLKNILYISSATSYDSWVYEGTFLI